MSNPQTYYITMNQSTGQFQDLSGIFQPLSLGTQYPTATGFQLSTGQDLNQIFADIKRFCNIIKCKLLNYSNLRETLDQ